MNCHYTTKVAFWRHSLGIKVTEVSGRLEGHVKAAEKFFKDFEGGGNNMCIIRKKAKSKAASYAKGRASVQQVQIRTTVVMTIVSTIELIVNTFPHSIYGRYPIYMESEGMESSAIYAKQAGHLKKMMDKVDEACTDLSGVVQDLSTARDKQTI